MLYPHGNDRIIHSNERDGPPARSAQTAQSLREGELRRLRGRANLDCLTLLWRHAYADHRIKPKQRAAPGSPPSAPRMPCITLARRGLGDRGITHECRHLASLPSAAERWSCSRQPGRGHGSAACPRPRFQPPGADRRVRAALAAAEHEVMKAGGLTIEIVRVRITAAGRRAPIDGAAEQLRLLPETPIATRRR